MGSRSMRLILSLSVVVIAVSAFTLRPNSNPSPAPTPEVIPQTVPINYAAVEAAVAQYQHGEMLAYVHSVGTWLQAEADRKTAEAEAAARKKQAASRPKSSGSVDVSNVSSFFQCVIKRESGGNPNALNSSSGAGGLYQFLPSTARLVAGWMGRPDLAATPPHLWPVADQHAGAMLLYERMGTSPWASTRAPCI